MAVRFASLVLASLLMVSTAAWQSEPVSVMSFNIRYGTARDGDNQWSNRRELLFDVVREENAAILALQEALDFQVDEILAAAPAYAAVGVGRNDGIRAGEHASILFMKDRFRVGESGTFWFSDTPSVPGSRSWGNNVVRICTYARFVDRAGAAFWVFNVHLDHESQPSRERSVLLLKERIVARAYPQEPVIVTGDFNAGESNPAMLPLIGPSSPSTAPFRDTFRALHPDEKTVGTANNFIADRVDGEKIDYILVQPGAEVLRAAIVRTNRDKRVPSDHFPVTATIKLPVPAK
jgi:endonuclease/exonuclease/phosphatase family metal-dependent hydrolase